MSIHTDNLALTEHDSHSDSDWLDIASTDRDSDDNDSIYSSRETDHEDHSRSRSRRSSLSYGSSRDGEVDAWEGLIEDSADEGMPNDVRAPSPHVASISQQPATFDLNHIQETSPEELLVKEGLDQSMMSTLSSSRSSSLHASTVGNSSRDLRLSFPDPITSSRREPLSTSYEEIRPSSDFLSSPTGSDTPSDVEQIGEEEMLSASRESSTLDQATSASPPSGPELKVFLYGSPTISKWSIVNRLLRKVAFGAGLSINSDLESLQGSVRQLTVSGSFEHDRAFPRTIIVLDKTLEPHDTAHDLALTGFAGIRPLAVVFMPCHPLDLPKHVLYLPIILPSHSGELLDFGDIEKNSPRWSDTFTIPNKQMLRVTSSGGPQMIHKDSIDTIDSLRAYQAFSRLWSGDNVSKGVLSSTHALTIIAILSLILGLVVRAALPVSLQQFTTPNLATLTPNSSSALWQMIRPAPHRERLPTSTTLDTSVVVVPSSFKDLSLSVFSAESTSITLLRANPTDFRRTVSPTVSERSKFSKDLMLQPPSSVLPPDSRPKALSVIPEMIPTTSSHPGPDTTGHMVSTLIHHPSIPGVVKECAAVVSTIMNQDIQDILDALDALVQAISRQTQMILTQATTFIEQSAVYLEKSVESFGMVKETFQVHNERARKRAKEIREMSTKWLYGASEMVVTSARFSQGIAWELAEGLAHRAQRARGRAKEVAVEIQDFLIDHDEFEAWGIDALELHAKHWDEWVKRVRRQGKNCNHKLEPSIFC